MSPTFIIIPHINYLLPLNLSEERSRNATKIGPYLSYVEDF